MSFIRAVSLILCHDKPKARAKIIEKLAEIAVRLRNLNNYHSLRAIISAINRSTNPGDPPMEIFRAKTDLHKKFLSSDILLRSTKAHHAYRMALKSSKGPVIPSALVIKSYSVNTRVLTSSQGDTYVGSITRTRCQQRL